MIELIASISLFSSVFSANTFDTTQEIAQATPKAVSSEAVKAPLTFESIVRNRFADKPVLVKIAICESGLKHFDKNGEVLKGWMTPQDIGVMQINKSYHLEKSKEMGLDIYKLEDNLTYAEYLYKTQGVGPWYASAPCWMKDVPTWD